MRDAVDPVDEEVFAGRAGEQAGRLGVRLGNQAGKALPDVVHDPGTVRRVDDAVLVRRRRDPAPAEELGDLLPSEPRVAAARQTVDLDRGRPVDERRPSVRLLLPVGEVEGVLLADLQGEGASARKPAGSGSRSSRRGQPAARRRRRPARRRTSGRRRCRSRYPADVAVDPGDRPIAQDPGAVTLRLLEQRAARCPRRRSPRRRGATGSRCRRRSAATAPGRRPRSAARARHRPRRGSRRGRGRRGPARSPARRTR